MKGAEKNILLVIVHITVPFLSLYVVQKEFQQDVFTGESDGVLF